MKVLSFLRTWNKRLISSSLSGVTLFLSCSGICGILIFSTSLAPNLYLCHWRSEAEASKARADRFLLRPRLEAPKSDSPVRSITPSRSVSAVMSIRGFGILYVLPPTLWSSATLLLPPAELPLAPPEPEEDPLPGRSDTLRISRPGGRFLRLGGPPLLPAGDLLFAAAPPRRGGGALPPFFAGEEEDLAF